MSEAQEEMGLEQELASAEARSNDTVVGSAADTPAPASPLGDAASAEDSFEADAVARAEAGGKTLEGPGKGSAAEAAEAAPPPVLPATPAPEATPKEGVEAPKESITEPPPENQIGELTRRLKASERNTAEMARSFQELAAAQERREQRREAREAGPPPPRFPMPTIDTSAEVTDYEQGLAAVRGDLAKTVEQFNAYITQAEAEKAAETNQREFERRQAFEKAYDQGFNDLKTKFPASGITEENEGAFWNLVSTRGFQPDQLEDALIVFHKDRFLSTLGTPAAAGAGGQTRTAPPAAVMHTEGGSSPGSGAKPGGFKRVSDAEYLSWSEAKQDAYDAEEIATKKQALAEQVQKFAAFGAEVH